MTLQGVLRPWMEGFTHLSAYQRWLCVYILKYKGHLPADWLLSRWWHTFHSSLCTAHLFVSPSALLRLPLTHTNTTDCHTLTHHLNMALTGWFHIWEQWSPQCVHVHVCVCGGDWGSVSGLGSFPSGPRVQSSESSHPYRLSWAGGQTPGPSKSPLTYAVQIWTLPPWRSAADGYDVGGVKSHTRGSCNATFHHV